MSGWPLSELYGACIFEKNRNDVVLMKNKNQTVWYFYCCRMKLKKSIPSGKLSQYNKGINKFESVRACYSLFFSNIGIRI